MGYTINNYRFRELDDNYFITTDSGSWIALNKDEFNSLKSKKIDEKLKQKLLQREILLDETNENEFVNDLRKRNSFLFQGASLHIVVVTLRCNMNCVYCHASSVSQDKKGFDMDKDTAKKTVDFIFQSPSPNITIEFQGGEPLLNWEILKFIVGYAKQKNRTANKKLSFSVVTNLSMMDEEKMQYLIRERILVCTSLDGPKELHDKNRIFASSSNYGQVVFWIKKFMEEYKKKKIENARINALVTLTKKSLGYPEEIVDEYVNLGLNFIHLRFLNNLGVAQKIWPQISYSVEEYLAFWEKAMGRIKKHQKDGKEISERIVDIIAHKIGTKYDPNYLDLRSPCGVAIGQLAYHYNGDVYTCDEGRMVGDEIFLLGNVKKDSYKDAVTCDKACAVLNASINDQFVCDACAYKPYCGLCPVCSFSEEGSIIGKVSQSARCRIFKRQFDWVVKERFINQKKDNK
ncbi:His-Xaa-Ser system radical SAM maturase HxsB [Candidatus Woesearchaeota archaeon]|nr:His-Xaa-Ser system radical SAM maturase HxsB [Candidatus Woesearchaeota archaeon]